MKNSVFCSSVPIPLYLLVIVLAPSTASALLRGDEQEPRSYEIGRLYFINRASYLPTDESLDRFASASNAYLGVAGSLRSSDLYLYHDLKLAQPLSDRATLNLRYRADRDFDGFWQRFEMGLSYALNPHWSVALVGQPLPDKERADIGAQVDFASQQLDLRVRVLLPQVVFNDKNSEGATYSRKPLNLQWAGTLRLGERIELYGQGDFDFASERIAPAQSYVFDFEKYQGLGGVRLRMGANGSWRGEVEAESAQKERTGLEPADPLDFLVDRDYTAVTVEYSHALANENQARLGSHWIMFKEDSIYPFDITQSLLLDRVDRILYGGRTWNMHDRVRLNMLALVNLLDYTRRSEGADVKGDENEFLARLATSLIFHAPLYQVECGATLNVTETRFGGGFVRVYAQF
jgi:hypothetical protein